MTKPLPNGTLVRLNEDARIVNPFIYVWIKGFSEEIKIPSRKFVGRIINSNIQKFGILESIEYEVIWVADRRSNPTHYFWTQDKIEFFTSYNPSSRIAI